MCCNILTDNAINLLFITVLMFVDDIAVFTTDKVTKQA